MSVLALRMIRQTLLALVLVTLSNCAPKPAQPSTANEPAANNTSTEPPTSPLMAPSDVAAPPTDAKVTASGLAYKVLAAGTGTAYPSLASNVLVHYTGWTTDGKMFDSSVQRGEPAAFPVAHVIKGWSEGVQLMVVGEKTRFWIPGALAYDGSNNPQAPRGMLVFDVELLEIQ